MADPAGGVSPAQVAALARLRRERERRALQELFALRRREVEAGQVREAAGRHLDSETATRRAGEAYIYYSLPVNGPTRPVVLERHRETIRQLGARVGEAAHHLDAASAALHAASEATEAGRARLVRQMRDSRKWQQIEARTLTAHRGRIEIATERENEDLAELRYRRSS